MQIALITPTCRENGRTMEMSRTIAAAVRHAADIDHLLWIIVDEKKRNLEALVDLKNTAVAETFDSDRISVMVIPPLSSVHREPGPSKAPAHNAARQAGLQTAFWFADKNGKPLDYVAFLNDCNLVTYGMGKVLVDCARQGVGYRAKMHEVPDMPVPADGIVKHKDHHDLLRRIPVESAAGSLWGAPARAFAETRGFDQIYDGQRYGNDLDMVVRLSRVGVSFVTTERAFVIQLRRTKIAEEITTRKDVQGDRNRAFYNNLVRDTKRILPIWAYGDPEPSDAPVQAASLPLVEEPKPKWKKRAPPIVGANLRGAAGRGSKAPIDPARAAGNAAPVAPAPATADATRPYTLTTQSELLKNAVGGNAAPPPAGPGDFDLGNLGDGDGDPLDELDDATSLERDEEAANEQKAMEQESAAAAVAAAQLRQGVPPAKA